MLKGVIRFAALVSIERMRILFLLSGIIAILISFGSVSASCSCSQSHCDQSFAKLDQSYDENKDSTDLISDPLLQTCSDRSERLPRSMSTNSPKQAASLHNKQTSKSLNMSPGSAKALNPGPNCAYVEHFGVAVTPPLWLANFLLVYFTNPDIGAFFPAYRAEIPQEVYKCLLENPEGCSYADMAQYFDEQALENGSCRKKPHWTCPCQTDTKWQPLTPPEYQLPGQINQPLGREKADELAESLGIDKEMILTNEQYECMIGTPPRDVVREIIFTCTNDLTNSKRNAVIPLSSYGLSLDVQGDVRSNCAPHAPCLLMNQLLKGPMEIIANQCGFEEKLQSLVNDTPLLELFKESGECQDNSGPACISETSCPAT